MQALRLVIAPDGRVFLRPEPHAGGDAVDGTRFRKTGATATDESP